MQGAAASAGPEKLRGKLKHDQRVKRMKHSVFSRIWKGACLGLCLIVVLGSSWAWGGPLRLKMTDGTAVEVNYYWEEGGELKFEIPGGIAGVPKVQVASVQEVVVNREFDPEVLAERTEAEGASAQMKMLRDLVSGPSTGMSTSERLTPEESLELLRAGRSTGDGARGKDRIQGALYDVQADFTELVRIPGAGVMIEMRKVVTSRNDLRRNGFTLNLFDGEGNIIQRQACVVNELDVDRKSMRQMGLKGRLFSLTASVRPDERIRRYEITADRR